MTDKDRIDEMLYFASVEDYLPGLNYYDVYELTTCGGYPTYAEIEKACNEFNAEIVSIAKKMPLIGGGTLMNALSDLRLASVDRDHEASEYAFVRVTASHNGPYSSLNSSISNFQKHEAIKQALEHNEYLENQEE